MKKDKSQTLTELELEQRKLSNLQVAANIRLQDFNMACSKIEHARRNIEITSRTWINLLEKNMQEDEVSKKMKEILLLNLEILNNTKQL